MQDGGGFAGGGNLSFDGDIDLDDLMGMGQAPSANTSHSPSGDLGSAAGVAQSDDLSSLTPSSQLLLPPPNTHYGVSSGSPTSHIDDNSWLGGGGDN